VLSDVFCVTRDNLEEGYSNHVSQPSHSEMFDRIQLQLWTPCPTSPTWANLFEVEVDSSSAPRTSPSVHFTFSVTNLRENDNVLALCKRLGDCRH